MKKGFLFLSLIACVSLTSCTQISISAFKAHTVANVILRNQENLGLSNTYTFTYTSNSFVLESNGNSSTNDISQTITYSKPQKYFRMDTYNVTSQTINGQYSKTDINKTEWVYVQDGTDLYIVEEDKLTNSYFTNVKKYVFNDEADFAFDSYYALLLPRFKSAILGTDSLHKIISIMETISFENEYSSEKGTSLSQKYASSKEGSLNANLYLNFSVENQENSTSYSGSNSISAIYTNNILIDYLEKFEYISYENNILSSRQYSTISSSFKDRFVQILKPNLTKK